MPNKTNNFIIEVAKYFMNFLETDFKKRNIPKRATNQTLKDWLLVGINLEKYPNFKEILIKSLNSWFEKEQLIIKKGSYIVNIPTNLFNLINLKVSEIEEEILVKYIEEIKKIIIDNNNLYNEEFDKFEEETLLTIKTLFLEYFISPLITKLEKSLENLDLSDENTKFELQYEILDFIFLDLEVALKDILLNIFNKNNDDLGKILLDIFQIDSIKSKITEFFKNFSIKDLFFEIYEVFKNNSLMDKSELYFYFYEITFWNNKFPLFYTTISVKFENDILKIDLDKKLYLNTKWIDFIVQEYNRLNNNSSTLNWEFERILYINQIEDIKSLLNWILSKIQNFFVLKWNLNIDKSELQKLVNQNIWLSNKAYLFLFDKGDESLVNDYEEIISWDNIELLNSFSDLLESFVKDNPKSFIKEVENEWDDYNIEQKLIYQSPIPLNEEQKQVINALNKKDCKLLILEWPPWTGKSHTITAIICKALLEEKSVLVLSDKKEALDVVEDKITHTLNKIRYDQEDFQNPILRLWKTWNKFSKIIQSQTLSKIKEHSRSFRKIKQEFEIWKNNIINDLEQNLKENVEHFTNISLKDIEYYFLNIDKFNDIDLIEEFSEGLLDTFVNIKNYSKEIRELNKDNIDLNNVSEDYLNLLIETNSKLSNIYYIKNRINHINSMKDLIFLLWEKNNDYLLNLKENLNRYTSFLESLWENIIYLRLYSDKNYSLDSFLKDLIKVNNNINIFNKTSKYLENNKNVLNFVVNFIPWNDISLEEVKNVLDNYIKKLKELKTPFLWYLFKKDDLIQLNREFKKSFINLNINNPHKNLNLILDVQNLFDFIIDKLNNENWGIDDFIMITSLLSNEDLVNSLNKSNDLIKSIENYTDIDFLNINSNDELSSIDFVTWYFDLYNSTENYDLNDLFTNNLNEEILEWEKLINYTEILLNLKDKIDYIFDFYKNNEKISQKISLDIIDLSSSLDNYSEDFIKEYFYFKRIKKEIYNKFNDFPEDIYWDYVSKLEDSITVEMANFIDERLIDYVENNANEVNNLKNIIANKLKFPKDLFQNLKKAFPCIIAWIRDYANYIPLEKDLFDLIIIDEASQVSISQALPAFIRWKQIIILWDDKQFSNVKSNNAKKEINLEYKSRIRNVFSNDYINWEDTLWLLSKIDKNFDIKNSVLKFAKFIRNYELQLKKHFRWYPELISYSNKYFYWNLQCMKIRWKNIEEVIKFDVIEHDWLYDKNQNINILEADFIIEKLKEFKNNWIKQSVWVISPHREQVSYIFSKVNELLDRDYFFEELELKIMTFDTCQWEERDYIFYSMVASHVVDKLQWIFPKSLIELDNEVEWTLKAQRLNVWFSRAKETIHFILSKPIEEFSWEIRNALIHFKNELELWKKKIVWWTDINSPMEEKIQHYFYETSFYKNNIDKIEFIPQFPIWEYLKQLSNNYNHPNYKVDFLLIYNNQKIIIEYDWFKEHFNDLANVNKFNYDTYMKEDDIYRQKILEWYWYSFLRINIFNIWINPVEVLNNRLEELTKKKIEKSKIINDLHTQIDKLHNWDDRTCDKCLNIFPSKIFPYKTKNLCVDCYEKINNKTLNSFRLTLKANWWINNISKNTSSDNITKNSLYIYSGTKCLYCCSTNLWSKWYRWDNKRLICKNCNKSWSVNLDSYVKPEIKKNIIKEDNFHIENTIEEVRNYLEIKKQSWDAVSFYYKDKTRIYKYYKFKYDNKYFYWISWNDYHKYLLDKIRKVIY